MATPSKLPTRPTPPYSSKEPTSIERVEAWTVTQAASALSATTLSSPTPTARPPRGTSVQLLIPLDTPTSPPHPDRPPPAQSKTPAGAVHTVHKRREPVRRDSLKRREALLKGKEGSRQRRRWENDRLVGNPHAQPPLPEDWEVRAVYERRSVPYFVAPLWEAEYARVSAEREARKRKGQGKGEGREEEVRREVKARVKRSGGARAMLEGLEREVRGFVEEWERRGKELEEDGVVEEEEGDSEDEEIVFVGRNGTMSDERAKGKGLADLERDKVVFESLVHDHGAAFGRFLVHAIAQYYDLATWSVTTGDAPPKRQAYVGVKTDPVTRRPSLTRVEMPRPLWTVV